MENKKISSGLELSVSKRLVLVGIASMGLGIVMGVLYMKQRLQQVVEVNYIHNLKIEHMQKEIHALKHQHSAQWRAEGSMIVKTNKPPTRLDK